ncbi:cardiac-enriched FHL2-interacting protein isoform X2 [Trachinotus anak]|uniref:cardiac-enriched FHL2-interacting protein isoform X2 n=1 Tax=Trachinotus anak TaxID=443729 RepID=UPI0039F207CA
MTSVEKRRSSRKSGGHRKHSDGGYSDTSSGGSFLDETDREVSTLTDRAFRSLCIGDEAVYNDSDLCSSSPCSQRDRQLAFSQSGQDRDREDPEREELKRAAHESFTLRVQQYGQDWIHGGMYGAEIHRDPQWEVYGERTQGRVSATFQHSFVETSQQEKSLREEQLSFFSNGATELSSQQRRSRSRVSSLIRAFNSEGQKDGAGMDGKLKQWNDETSWDKSALMSIQRELSEFSTSYQQNFNSDHFPSAGPFSSRDTSFYSSEVAAVAHMNSASSFMSASHSKHSMSTQVNCNSNFFIHSEFSPFKVWRDHNRFPFQQGEVSGFMHCSEFPKWYETPMYKELSLEAQPQGPYRLKEREIRHPRNKLAAVGPPTPPRSTSTSTMLQKAAAVEKRCESELAGHYPHRKRTQSLGTNRLPSQRPSTASPTIEMSRRVRDTISSVKALHQKIKMMTEENMSTGMPENQQKELCSNDNLIPFGNNAVSVAPNAVRSNTSTTPFNISQLLTPSVHAYQDAETAEVRQYAASPQPVEHPPVRAESRGATPDVRMSSYKSRATSLLFNLKDNRKRVKNTYSPPKFKGLEKLEKNKPPSIQEPRDIVIDIPDLPDPDIQFTHIQESSRTHAASHQYANQYQNPGLSLATLNSQPATAHAYSEYTLSDYQTAQMQGEMVHHSRLTGFIPENYTTNQLANGQYLHEDLLSFTPHKEGITDNVETLGGNVYRLKPPYTATETPRLNADNNQAREYLISKANAEQHFNETVGREITKEDRYQQLKDNKNDYSNVSSQDRWRQTSSQSTEKLSLKAANSPWKQEITALIEKDQHAQAYQRAAMIKEELNIHRDKYRGENQQSINKELEKIELRESSGAGTSSHKNTGLVNPNISNQLPQYAPFSNDTVENHAYYGQQQPGTIRDKYGLQKFYGHNEENVMKENYLPQNYNSYTDQEYRNQHTLYSNKDKTMLMQETGQRKQYSSVPKGHEKQSLQPVQAKPQFEHNMEKKIFSNTNVAAAHTMANQVKDRQIVEVKAEQASAEHLTAQHAQAELAKVQHWAQVEQSEAELPRLILAEQTGSEKAKAEQTKAELTEHERVKQAKAEHVKEENRKGERAEQSRGKQPEHAREEKTKVEQTRVQNVTEEPRNIKEEAGAMQMKEEQGEQVKAEQAKAERLKEEHIKTDRVKNEQAKIQQAAQARRERIKVEQVEEEGVRAQQIESEQGEAEQIRTEKVKAEQVKTDLSKAEQAKQEQIKEQLAKTEQEKMNIVEMATVKADHIKVKDIRQEKAEEDSVQMGQVNAEPPTSQISKAKEAEQTKLEQTKVERAKAELTKTEKLQERLAKPAAKLTVIQQVKNEPDKVKQVKTELAKAKAELAKIKEKMRGEQKEKVRNSIIVKDDDIKKKDIRGDMNKNEDYKKTDQTPDKQQQEEESVVSRNGKGQADTGADEYECVREKYGFTNSVSTNKNKVSTGKNDSSNSASETPALCLDKVKTMNNEKSKDKHSPTSRLAAANTDIEEEVGSFKSNEMTESHYVYSESSKEFKLSSPNYLPTHVDNRANCDTVSDKVKDDSVQKLEKCDPVKHTDVSQRRDSDLTKLVPAERKPKSTEHSLGKDPHFIPPRALSHKERVQTKQEILTSKIKAHAEKEISAIKEKGFAIRDSFISKHPTKQLAGSQSNNARQRPPSQEVSKKHESTMSSNITPKHQTELSGIQMEPVKSMSTPSSATIPVKSAARTCQLVDHSQKQVPKEPKKSHDSVIEQHRDANQTGSYITSTDEGLVENQKKENQLGIKSPMPSKEQAPKNNQEKQEANHGANSGQEKDGFKGNSAISTDHLNKKKEDPSLATALLKADSSKPMTTKKPESTHEAGHEDSAPSLHLAFGQNKIPVADDSLHIMGIMVIVRERKTSESNDQGDNNSHDQINTKKKECSNSAIDKCDPSSGLELCKGNESLKEVTVSKTKDKAAQETYPTVMEDQIKVAMNNYPEKVQEPSTQETRKQNVSENVTEKGTNLQETSSINAGPEKEIQLQDPLADKGVPSIVTVPAKNEVLAETQPILYKQDIIAREMKDYSNKMPKESSAKNMSTDLGKRNTEEKNPRQTAHTNENFTAKVENTGINCENDSNAADAKTPIKHDVKLSVTEGMTAVVNPPKSRNIDGKTAPLLEEKRHDSTQIKPVSKTTPSHYVTENQNRYVSPKLKHKETHNEEYNKVDDDVHIDSIAIKVVPAVTEKDNLKMAEKDHVTTVPSDVVVANGHEQVASSSCKEKVNDKDRTKDPTPANTEKQKKENLEEKLGVQNVLSNVRELSNSLQISNQQNIINTTTENTQAETGKPERQESGKDKESGKSIDESMEGNYFQVQGIAETNNEPHNSANVRETLDSVSKEREFPRLVPNKASVSNKPYKDVKNQVFELDPGKSKTVESSSVSVQNQNMEKKNSETEDKLASKESDGPTERQSNNVTMEAGQDNHIREHHTVSQSTLSARERQSSRNSHPSWENSVKDKPEVKPKPKERVSTIPEISAIADYARLKVIVSEERANTIQEYPPNKKEGFFPLIQTRHSRRPVFTADPKDVSVKEKSLPNKTEVSAKVNKEPKAPVFPITEKEHQRTGMFKLGDKERQEKMVLNTTGVLDAGAKHAQCLKERNKSPTTHLKNQESEDQVAGTDTQRLCQVDQGIHQPDNPPLQALNRPRNISVSLDIASAQYTKPEEFSSKAERVPDLDKNSQPQPTLRQVHNIEVSTTTIIKDEKIENKRAKIGEERKDELRQERLVTQHEETAAREGKHASRIEEERRAEDMRIKHIIEESRASLAEEERRAARREEERRVKEREAIAIKIRERREKQREADRRAEEERKAKQIEEDRAAQKEEEIRAKQREEERRVKETEKKRIKVEEERRAKLRREEEQIKENEERRRLKQQEERAAQEEQQRRALLEEQQRKAALEEQQRKTAQEEQRRRAALQVPQRRAAQEEQQKRAAQEEQQRKAALEEQHKRAAQEEQQRKAALEEQHKRAVQEEQQRRAAQEEQQKRAAQEEQQRRAAQEEHHRRAAQEEQQRRAALEEQHRRAAQEEHHRRAAQEEQQSKAALEDQHRRAAQEKHQRRAAQEEQQRRAALQEQKKQAKQIETILVEIEEEKKQTERKEKERKADEKEKTIRKQREEKQAKEERIRLLEESQAALKEDTKRATQEQIQAQREDDIRAKQRDDKHEEKFAAQREKERATKMEEQERAAQRMDALQYYAITSTESERKPKERQLCSPSPSQQRSNPSGLESTEESGSHTRLYRPRGPASPAPSLPRSNTSSPALGAKPSMFRVKDNTIRGSAFTKSVKPRFHKNFGEDFRVGSPMERLSERGEEEQEIRRSDIGLNRLAAIKEFSTFQSASSSQDYSAHLPQHRPYSRRSIALDEDDSRSVISNMSEDVESFATSTADLADIRGLFDYERPESACSFSSDVSRSLGKPPAVPPKSEKALRRAKRLTTRRIKKESCKAAADSPVEKPLQEGPGIPPSSSTEPSSSSDTVPRRVKLSSVLPIDPAQGAAGPRLWTVFRSGRTCSSQNKDFL